MLSRQSDDVGVAEVAERVGYASASTFIEMRSIGE
jgi:AraC-like DNA-binding protein